MPDGILKPQMLPEMKHEVSRAQKGGRRWLLMETRSQKSFAGGAVFRVLITGDAFQGAPERYEKLRERRTAKAVFET